jgi:hypothetical protein
VRDRQARVDLVRCRLTSQDHSWNWALLFRPFRGGWNFTWWYVRGSVHTEAVANKADKSQMDKTTLRCRSVGSAAVRHQVSVFDRPDLMRTLAARKTTPPARSHGPPTMTASIG